MKRSGPPERRTPLRRRIGLRPAGPVLARRPKPATQPRDNRFDADTRRAIFTRDRWECQARHIWPDIECNGRLHAHHVILRSQGGPGTVDNGLTVCALHHLHAHDVDRAGAEAAGIIRRTHADQT